MTLKRVTQNLNRSTNRDKTNQKKNIFRKKKNLDLFYNFRVNWEELTVARETHPSAISNITDDFLNDTESESTTLPNVLFSQTDSLGPTNSSTLYSFFSITEGSIDTVRQYYIYMYTVLVMLLLLITLNRTFAFFKMCLLASINLHDKLFRGITRATMHFFNNNPSGRILNRFSKDIGAIDTLLPNAMIDCLNVSIY